MVGFSVSRLILKDLCFAAPGTQRASRQWMNCRTYYSRFFFLRKGTIDRLRLRLSRALSKDARRQKPARQRAAPIFGSETGQRRAPTVNSRVMSKGIGIKPFFRDMPSLYFLAEGALRWVVVTRASTWLVSSLTTVSTTFIVRPACTTRASAVAVPVSVLRNRFAFSWTE